MTEREPLRGWARRWRLSDGQRRYLGHLLILLAAGVVLLTFGPRPTGDVSQRTHLDPAAPAAGAARGAGAADDYARALERQVEAALGQLFGAAPVHVSVTVETGPRRVLAEHVTTERRTGGAPGAAGTGDVVLDERRSAQPVLVRSDQQRREEPVVLVEHAPVVSGVLVITDAARDARRRYEITRAVMTLLGLPAHRVYVMPRQP